MTQTPQRISQLLTKLYLDPETGFQSAPKLYKKAKAIDASITNKIVKDFLASQESVQITKETKRAKYHHIVAHHPGNGWQMDLMDMSKYSTINKNYKWILTIIDIYSRRAWALPLKSKGAEHVEAALKELFKTDKPEQISTDLGGEFKKEVSKLFEKHNIKHWQYEPGSHNTLGIIERFNRTLRTMLRKYWSAFDTFQWVEILPKLIKNYNSSYHRTIDAAPILVYNGKADPLPHDKPKVATFAVGDRVRRKVVHHILEKKTVRWSKETYVITALAGRKYMLDDLKTPVGPQDLQLISGEIQKAEKQIKDAPIAKKAIKQKKIDDELKSLDIDQSKILNTKRVKTKSSKLKDFV